MQQYGFDKDGGFYVIDHAMRCAEYAYPSSPHAEQAKCNPQAVLGKMVDTLKANRKHGDPDIVERHYLSICEHAQPH